MAEIQTADKKHGRRKKLSTRVDLTPMVDLGFLLITFFVFTTTMSQPSAMNFNEPAEDSDRPVKESGAMTILLGAGHSVYYYFGKLTHEPAGEQFKSTSFQELRSLILQKKKHTKISDLMYIIKSTPGASFKDVVDVLDEMTISNVAPGHYAEQDISESEKLLIEADAGELNF